MDTRFIRFKELQKLVGLSRTTVWRLERNKKFPNRLKLSPNCVAWDKRAVDEWMANRPKQLAFDSLQITEKTELVGGVKK